MSAKWPLVSLGELLRLERRPVELDPETLYPEIGIYCFGKGIFHKLPRTGFMVGDKDLFALKKDDFILQITFAWEGAVAVVSEKEVGMFGSTRYPTFRVDEARCIPQFLQLYFRTYEGLQQLIKISPGSAGRNRVLSMKRIPEVMVPLPPLPEQRRLVARIEALAALVAEAKALRKEAVEEAESLLISMAHRPDLSDEVKRTKGWQKMKLGECISFVSHMVKVDPSAEYPNIGMYSYARGVFGKPPIKGVATTAKELRQVKRGQFIYSRLFAFEGAYGIVPNEFDRYFVSSEYPTFECQSKSAIVEFIGAYFKSPEVWRQVAVGSKGLGSRRQRVQPDQVLAHEAWIPPLTWQRRIHDITLQLGALRTSQAATAAELDALMGAVLGEVFGQGKSAASYAEPGGELSLAAEPQGK